MQVLKPPSAKSHSPHFRLINIIVVLLSLCFIYLLGLLIMVGTPKFIHLSSFGDVNALPTSLDHIVFGIASSDRNWPKRKDYLKLWWKPEKMRGCTFLESMPLPGNDSGSLPPVCISGDTSRFPYTFRKGPRSAIRLARIVSEIVALNHTNVRWYVFGDDDTIFFPENLAKTLSKYDHGLWYYIGSNSEIYEQNKFFGFNMAFAGGGFAISYPLARVFARVFDSCIQRYPHLYSGDSRVYTCLAELGVGFTHEPGFHQMDVRGDVFGLLTSHPVTPLLSLHHLDNIDPIFPNMTTIQSLEHFLEAVNVDSQRVLQKTVCYDRWFSWTISVSWGYAVEVYGYNVYLPDALPVQTTFKQWRNKEVLDGVYTFNTREPDNDPCRRPTVFFLDHVSSDGDKITSHYKKVFTNCSSNLGSPRRLLNIKVFSHKLDLSNKQLMAPRRHCCNILPSPVGVPDTMEVAVRECKEEELIYMHP